MKDENGKEIYLLDDPRNVKHVNNIEGYVCRHGCVFTSEFLARQNSYTHYICPVCGKYIKKHTYCKECKEKELQDKYDTYPKVEWDEKTPICIYDDDKYFFDMEQLLDYCDEYDINIKDLKLVLCKPIYFNLISDDCLLEQINNPDYEELPQEIQFALDSFNEVLKNVPSGYYEATETAVYIGGLE